MSARCELSPTPTLPEVGLKEVYAEYYCAYIKLLASRGLPPTIVESTSAAEYEFSMDVDVTNAKLPEGLEEQICGFYGKRFNCNLVFPASLIFKPGKVDIKTLTCLLEETGDGEFYFPPSGSGTSQLVSSEISIDLQKGTLMYYTLDPGKPRLSEVGGNYVDNAKKQTLEVPPSTAISLVRGFTAVLEGIAEKDKKTPLIIKPWREL